MIGGFLPVFWYFLLGLIVILFVILDGADLGIGMLSLFALEEKERGVMVSVLGPMWYANETWLVIFGGTLFGAFPLAYGVVLSALYIPGMTLIFALILRAVSVEFRANSERKRLWGTIFGIGSLLAVIAQGFILGGVLTGVKVQGRVFAGGPWDWLSPLSVLITVGFLLGYAMLGGAYMLRRYEGEYLSHQRRLLRITAPITFGIFIAVLVTLPFMHAAFAQVWLTLPHVVVVPFFVAGAIVGFAMLISSARRPGAEQAPYPWAVVVFLCAAAAIVAGIFPYMIPFGVTIGNAAAPHTTLIFMIFGVAIVVPIIIVYNLYAHGVFRGKIYGEAEKGEGY